MVGEFTKTQITAHCGRFTRSSQPCRGIIISAVDSMSARKAIWEAHKDYPFGVRAIIDPRMGAEHALLYVMNPGDEADIEAYERSLYADDEAVQEPCTAKATIYTANMLAGLVCKAVKDLSDAEGLPSHCTMEYRRQRLHRLHKDSLNSAHGRDLPRTQRRCPCIWYLCLRGKGPWFGVRGSWRQPGASPYKGDSWRTILRNLSSALPCPSSS